MLRMLAPAVLIPAATAVAVLALASPGLTAGLPLPPGDSVLSTVRDPADLCNSKVGDSFSPVCCEKSNNFNGLISIGCSPVVL